jgi:hypothetical protein
MTSSVEILENGDQLKNSHDTSSISSVSVSIKSLTMKQRLKMLLAEVIGTALLVFFGCMGCIKRQ